MKKKSRTPLLLLKIVAILILIAFAVGIRVFLQPLHLNRLHSKPDPLWSYEQAVERIAALEGTYDTVNFQPACSPRFFTYNVQTNKVYVFIHDYMNCPQQCLQLAEYFFEQKSNVLMLPLPHHGLQDKSACARPDLTAEEMTGYADSLIDIASLLGKRVVVVGVSAGAVVAAWIGQMRSSVSAVVLITPAFRYNMSPFTDRLQSVKLMCAFPTFPYWFDPVLKIDGTPKHTCPQYTTHGIAQVMRMGLFVEKQLHHSPPLAKSYTIITNENDSMVDNSATAHFTALLKKYDREVVTYEFPRQMQLGTDIIDPLRTDEQVHRVYPQLFRMISRN